MADQCPFCRLLEDSGFSPKVSSPLAVAFEDGYPLNTGHTLVIPRRHEADLFALSPDERAEIWALVDRIQSELADDLSPDAFNVGVNVGQAAGQTVAHAHVHVIPRFEGDVEDPRGGVRWVVPSKARYW